MDIFKWYNVPSAWAIICHNIWLAEKDSKDAEKYENFGLGGLIYSQGESPISYYNHPLLFLLDFVDTIDPVKRFGEENLEHISIRSKEMDKNKLYLKIGECDNNTCLLAKMGLDKIKKDLSFLESDTFSVSVADGITFEFK